MRREGCHELWRAGGEGVGSLSFLPFSCILRNQTILLQILFEFITMANGKVVLRISNTDFDNTVSTRNLHWSFVQIADLP